MNALEQEYRDNVEQVKQREFRRGMIAAGVGIALSGAAFVAYVACDSNVQTAMHNASDSLLTALVVVPSAALFAAVRLAWRLRSPGVVVDMSEPETTTMEVERGYRMPVPAKATPPSRPKSPIPYMLALIPIGVAFVAMGVATDVPHHVGRFSDRSIAFGITFVLTGIILVAKHLYGAWRARRNARLELEWERRLDSADAGQVRAGERAK